LTDHLTIKSKKKKLARVGEYLGRGIPASVTFLKEEGCGGWGERYGEGTVLSVEAEKKMKRVEKF